MADLSLADMPELANVLRCYALDLDSLAVTEFLTLVYQVAIYRLDNPGATCGAGAALRAQAAKAKRYYLGHQARLKHAIRPIFDAGPDYLAGLGVYPKKMTVCGIIWALSDLLV